MSEQEKKGLVPVLRFPEFQNNGEWEVKEIGEVFDVTRGYVLSMGLVIEVYSETAPYPVYSSQTKNNGLAGYYSEFLYENAITWTTDGANAGDVNYRKGKFYCTNVCGVIINDQGFANPCIAALLNSVTRKYVSYVGNPKLMNGVMSKIKIPFPTLEEQQKIADCLTSIDELITAQTQKLDAFKTHKKGLMQQLFPAEGETTPKLRFPEFRDKGEWVCEEVSHCIERVIDYRGKAPPKSDSGIPLITARNVRFGWLDMTNDEYIDADEYEDWMSKGMPKAGDILFTTEAPLGNVAFFPSVGKFALGQRIITLRTRVEKCLPEFLFQSLLGPRMQREIDFHSTGSTAKGIKSTVFVNISYCYPGIEEQQRIADCLTSLDELITAQAQKLEALKTHKKGLMQQLFPAIDDDCMDDKAGVNA